MTAENQSKLLENIVSWAKNQDDLKGLLLVGSFARGQARPDSDIDLIFLTDRSDKWVMNNEWYRAFGNVESSEYEDWGAVKTVRVYFEKSLEVEFNFAAPSWGATHPIDTGTFKVVSDGSQILYDPEGFLAKLVSQVLQIESGIK